ncbi:hypothetical protein [Bradyrhizobium sp. McL0616]|uniref:hypothetical protein n=1 Tax=Bradyrhizobium sp. McL0616 TaxID=3415674 RepID=UPI003CF4AB92
MFSRLTKAVAVAVAMSTIGTSAFAQGTMQQQNACRPDVFRLCGSYIPNVGAIVGCLRGNEARLSEPCREVLFPEHSEQDDYERTTRIHSGEVQ